MKSRLTLFARTGLPAFVIAMVAAASQPATQNALCGPRSQIVAHLSHQQKQSRFGVGLISHNLVMELYASETGRWTIMVSNTENESCVIAAGQALELLPATPGRKASFAHH